MTNSSYLAWDFPSFIWQVLHLEKPLSLQRRLSSVPTPGQQGWKDGARYVLLLRSLLPVSPQSTAYTGHTRWEARMQGSLYDSVCKGRLEGAQSRAEKDQEWTWEILVGVQ